VARPALIAKMTAKEGRRDELLAALQPLVAAVQSEPGTVVYALNVSSTEPEVVYFYEIYADQDAVAVHSGSEAMKATGPALAGLLAGRPEFFRLEQVAGKGLPD
jgi:quinol monooxygenase YgiN